MTTRGHGHQVDAPSQDLRRTTASVSSTAAQWLSRYAQRIRHASFSTWETSPPVLKAQQQLTRRTQSGPDRPFSCSPPSEPPAIRKSPSDPFNRADTPEGKTQPSPAPAAWLGRSHDPTHPACAVLCEATTTAAAVCSPPSANDGDNRLQPEGYRNPWGRAHLSPVPITAPARSRGLAVSLRRPA
ncbi:hypothetical protein NDU88_004386 [Pleurodeles waltl]|uniref:Uncharacterized protein n=1 Tax=Pleurodeles waltl TaxID=8319 RepID=A0AAV7LL61_PLEWA|nr:hypothetical protein NDU88_004386 [Pleurodeles waltl]